MPILCVTHYERREILDFTRQLGQRTFIMVAEPIIVSTLGTNTTNIHVLAFSVFKTAARYYSFGRWRGGLLTPNTILHSTRVNIWFSLPAGWKTPKPPK